MVTQNEEKIIGWESPVLIHPGEHLQAFLEDTGISQVELSERIGISKKAVNEIVKRKNPITQQTAFRLSKVFSVSPEFWINLQNNYNIAAAHFEEEKRIQIEIKNHLQYFKETYQELCKIRVFPGARWIKANFTGITKELQKFFAIDSLGFVQERTMGFAFRKYERKNFNPYSVAAWVQMGRIKAQGQEVPRFDRGKLLSKLSEIKALSRIGHEEYIHKLESILAECGVVFACVPKIKNTHIQGATKWMDSDKVLLMLNTTNKDEGKFWFNLFHEIGHILLHGKRDIYIDFEESKQAAEERESDSFAQRSLIPDFDKFYSKLEKEKNLKKAVKLFAEENNVSSAIVAGRITYELDNTSRIHKLMNQFLRERIDYSNLKL